MFQTRLDCGSLSVYVISLQPFVSNTFDYGFLFVYPPAHTKMKVAPDWRRFYIKPELQNSCQSSWRKSNYFEWMMWHWYARKRSMSHEKLSFIVRTMCATSVEGEWFKLAATDYDIRVNMSTSGLPRTARNHKPHRVPGEW